MQDVGEYNSPACDHVVEQGLHHNANQCSKESTLELRTFAAGCDTSISLNIAFPSFVMTMPAPAKQRTLVRQLSFHNAMIVPLTLTATTSGYINILASPADVEKQAPQHPTTKRSVPQTSQPKVRPLPPLASRIIFNIALGPMVVLTMSATAWTQREKNAFRNVPNFVRSLGMPPHPASPTFAAMMFPNCAFFPVSRLVFAVRTAIGAAGDGKANRSTQSASFAKLKLRRVQRFRREC